LIPGLSHVVGNPDITLVWVISGWLSNRNPGIRTLFLGTIAKR
jgi:hypothetical protein